MSLRRIQVSDFRCLQSAEVALDSDFTLISGPNASGKTSVLEAVYVLGRGRSFRTRRLDRLIRSGTPRFLVTGEAGDDHAVRLGVEGSPLGIRAKMGGDRVTSLAELAALLPVQVIDPEVHRLIEEGPGRRRRFLDWGVFHVEHGFVYLWQRYQQTLRQRNAALKAGQAQAEVYAWDVDLAKLGSQIHEARLAYIANLTPVATAITNRLVGAELSIHYRSGWSRDLSLGEALKGSWAHDRELGSTQVGPQRAEIVFRLGGSAVKDHISRGQQKLLASALLLAQLSLFPSEGRTRPTLLLDDPAAELDEARLGSLIREVAQHSLQLVVTSLSPTFEAFGRPGRRYLIDAGAVREVS